MFSKYNYTTNKAISLKIFMARFTMIDRIIEIVKEAANIMLDDQHFVVKEKDGVTNLVTTNDVRVQEFLQDRLVKLLPDSSFFCEEGDVKDLSKDYVWIIDPIDGTTNYARHITVCAISVALEYKGEIIKGVVFNPYQNLLFAAEKGNGSFLNGKKIHVSDKKFNEAVVYTAFSAYDKTQIDKTFKFAHDIFPLINDLRRTGSSAFEISSVAAGRGDMFIELKLSPWDYAAASLIIKEAGGYISGKDINCLPLDQPSIIIAANTKENFIKLHELADKYL